MFVHREKFLAAALALSAAPGCDLTAAIASRITPEKAEEGVSPSTQVAEGDDALDRRGSESAGRPGSGVARTPSPTMEGQVLASPTKEWGVSPTKEAGMPSPTKEWGVSPTKEWGVSPTKEAGLASPTKETAKPRPPPVKPR